jgi:hypothetical protein
MVGCKPVPKLDQTESHGYRARGVVRALKPFRQGIAAASPETYGRGTYFSQCGPPQSA